MKDFPIEAQPSSGTAPNSASIFILSSIGVCAAKHEPSTAAERRDYTYDEPLQEHLGIPRICPVRGNEVHSLLKLREASQDAQSCHGASQDELPVL